MWRTSRADALRVVEAIELLLDAGQWHPADGMHTSRCGEGAVWKHLPAARLGQRAASAFVATPGRRDACATSLGSRDVGRYLAAAGLFAMLAGDLATAREYLPMAVRLFRDTPNRMDLAIGLTNLSECFCRLGQTRQARDAATEALTSAEASSDRRQAGFLHALLGRVAAMAGDTLDAERQFALADQIEVARSPDGAHLCSQRGTRWADWLLRTGRPGPARILTDRNAEICRSYGWNEDVAQCDRLLGRLALAARDTATATARLASAAECFRDGDFLTELADTLPDLADCVQATGDLGAADRHATEAITIAAVRGLVPVDCAALAARARIRAAQATGSGSDPGLLFQGRDAADAALRLAARHHLPWQELDALRAHAALDQVEGIDRGWAAKADALYARLVPPDLDPDPLATVERLVAEQKAAEADSEEGD